MPFNQNVWDVLGKSNFNTHIKEDEIDPRAADNILIAWPPILELLQSQFLPNREVNVLDYGCGTGGFCNKLFNLGYEVTGVDLSEEMINTAKHNTATGISYHKGDQTMVYSLGKFQIITSIMTLQFIENLNSVFQTLSNSLLPGGLLIIVDFNKEWVKECLKIPISFADFDSNDNPKKGWKTFGEIKTPVFIRESKDYDLLATNNNLQKILEVKPPFTVEFNEKYPDKRPKNVSEYLILGYKKF
ncbi:MAG: class I SAM-dependent methyltransferase [Patescibacteria group bacterium]